MYSLYRVFLCVCWCVLHCIINVYASSIGNLCALAEGQFQRGVCRLDSRESSEGVRGISPQVSAAYHSCCSLINSQREVENGRWFMCEWTQDDIPCQVRAACELSGSPAADRQEVLKETQRRTGLALHAPGPNRHCQQDRRKRPNSHSLLRMLLITVPVLHSWFIYSTES